MRAGGARTLRILMLAPEPFFQPRGTAFSVLHRLNALSKFGHTIDLVTYPLGVDREFPGVTIHRVMRPPFLRAIKIGPSFAKIPLDFFMFWRATWMLLTRKYDILHTHEEAGFIGLVLTRVFRVKHLYDMHSSLPQQLYNFEFTRSRIVAGIFRWLERLTLHTADAVITICPELDRHVAQISPSTWRVMIENVMEEETRENVSAARADLIARLGLPATLTARKIILYAGTFEPYQGLDLLLDSAKILGRERNDAIFLMVGGKPEQVAAFQAHAAALGLSDSIFFTGWRPSEEIKLFTSIADILASPRTKGTNTPLKIYSYLRSGKPIVATRLLTHTQVLNDSVSILAEPEPGAFAGALLRALEDQTLAATVAANARRLAAEQYSFESYIEKMDHVCEWLSSGGARPEAA